MQLFKYFKTHACVGRRIRRGRGNQKEIQWKGSFKNQYGGLDICFKVVSTYQLIRQISMQSKTVLFKGRLVDCYLLLD